MQYRACEACSGSGSINCAGCGGFGFHPTSTARTRYDGNIEYVTENRPCSCSGGKVACPTCGGRGSVLDPFGGQTGSQSQTAAEVGGETSEPGSGSKAELAADSQNTTSQSPAAGRSKGNQALWAVAGIVGGAIISFLGARKSRATPQQPSAGESEQKAQPLDLSNSFILEEAAALYHPSHPGFYVQYLGGVVFFTRIPGASGNESVRIQSIAEGRWNTFPAKSRDGLTTLTIPVAICRQGSTLRGKWL